MEDLQLVSCARSRWKAGSLHFKTHRGDIVHRPSQIDYICISKRSRSSLLSFGVTAPDLLMLDFDHALLHCTLDV